MIKNEPAFPYKGLWTTTFPNGGKSTGTESFPGLTKREWFTGLAMQSLAQRLPFDKGCWREISRLSIELVDEVIKQLEETK